MSHWPWATWISLNSTAASAMLATAQPMGCGHLIWSVRQQGRRCRVTVSVAFESIQQWQPEVLTCCLANNPSAVVVVHCWHSFSTDQATAHSHPCTAQEAAQALATHLQHRTIRLTGPCRSWSHLSGEHSSCTPRQLAHWLCRTAACSRTAGRRSAGPHRRDRSSPGSLRSRHPHQMMSV